MDRRDWPLVALSYARDGALTPLQMQKAMFLCKMEAGQAVGENFYDFIPYNYGPFDPDIYSDVLRLKNNGLVTVESDGQRAWPTYTITREGKDHAMRLRGDLDDEVATFLERTVEWIKRLGFAQLLRAIYAKYPDYAVNSVFSQ